MCFIVAFLLMGLEAAFGRVCRLIPGLFRKLQREMKDTVNVSPSSVPFAAERGAQ